MSTIIYQNRASSSCHHDPETTTTTTLKLKFAPPPPTPATFNDLFFHHSAPKQSSLKKQSSYIHPLLQNSSSFSRFSAKSLELCTEYLGSETGSDFIISSISNSSTHLDLEPKQSTKSLNKPLQVEKIKSCRNINNFPPPLSTLSGSRSLQVRRYREDGRLIIEAVEVPIMNACLQAERSNGRLRLFVNKEQKEEEEEDSGTEKEEKQKEEEDSKTDKEEFDDGVMNMELGMEKFGRMTSRCNGSEALCSNWKPALWVATS